MEDHKETFSSDPERLDRVRLTMAWSDDKMCCDFELNERFVSETGSTPSAFLCGIMDVLMRCAALVNSGKVCVARSVDTEFIGPVKPNRPYRAIGQFIKKDGNDGYVTARISDDSGNTCATANAIFRESEEATIRQGLSQPPAAETGNEPQKARWRDEYFPYGPL